MAHERITLKDPTRFRDPASLTWERYIALQPRERERYLAERAAIPPEALAYKTVGPRYVERATEQFANNYFPELSATRYVATAAANAPFDELKKCCLFQLADEQRHLEMDRDVFELDHATWAIHGYIAYDGEVIAATFASEKEAWAGLSRLEEIEHEQPA